MVKWQSSEVVKLMKLLNPATEEIIGKASKANKDDIDKALKNLLKRV